VETLSDVMDWTFVPVPASVFFDKGFDFLEARATEVFRKLSHLTQCVIFLDEFEEFFRKRPNEESEGRPDEESEKKSDFDQQRTNNEPNTLRNRTIAAFTTSSMLPRLQELHDTERNIIIPTALNSDS